MRFSQETGDARSPRLWPAQLGLTGLAFPLILGLLAWAGALFAPGQAITEAFFREDVVAAVVSGAFVALMMVSPAFRSFAFSPSPGKATAFAAFAAAVVALAGWRLVMRAYPLSMDEFMASFDAAIFRHGRLFATVPEPWRFVRIPLQPQFMMFAPDGQSWASSYLPTNAMALALFGRLGGPSLAGAVWAAVSVVATYGVGRKLWPERPGAAAVAAVLLATSSQMLVTAMTPYAMSAHLALNMVWLWLFLRGDRRGDLGALAVGLIACGLHQVVFHPLFVAPFILELLLAKRWRRAGLYILAYAAMGLFWLLYWKLALPGGSGASAGGGAMGLDIWVERFNTVKGNFTVTGLGLMAKNLFRLVAWQNPMLSALAALGFAPAMRVREPLRPLAVGVVLMLLTVTAIMPYQGHGWGYRYLHGLLGGLCLIGAFAWVRLTEPLSPDDRQALNLGFALSALFAVAVMLPLHAIQANRFLAPYARADAAIRHTDAEVVVVDTTGLMFGSDLVRNAPDLSNRPRVLDLMVMRDDQIRALCGRRAVVMFDQASGAGLRAARYRPAIQKRLAENRAAMRALSCDGRRLMVR